KRLLEARARGRKVVGEEPTSWKISPSIADAGSSSEGQLFLAHLTRSRPDNPHKNPTSFGPCTLGTPIPENGGRGSQAVERVRSVGLEVDGGPPATAT